MQTLTEAQATGPVLESAGAGRWRTQGDLGPKQIGWLAEKVYQFGPAKQQADAAIAHSAEIASRIESNQS